MSATFISFFNFYHIKLRCELPIEVMRKLELEALPGNKMLEVYCHQLHLLILKL